MSKPTDHSLWLRNRIIQPMPTVLDFIISDNLPSHSSRANSQVNSPHKRAPPTTASLQAGVNQLLTWLRRASMEWRSHIRSPFEERDSRRSAKVLNGLLLMLIISIRQDADPADYHRTKMHVWRQHQVPGSRIINPT